MGYSSGPQDNGSRCCSSNDNRRQETGREPYLIGCLVRPSRRLLSQLAIWQMITDKAKCYWLLYLASLVAEHKRFKFHSLRSNRTANGT